jgi:glycosyltransferase involved in cell wall biosynthesis
VAGGGVLIAQVEALGFPVKVIKCHGKFLFLKWFKPMAIWKVKRYIEEQKTHVVQTRLFLGNTVGRIAAILAGIKVIVAAEHNTYRWKNIFHKTIDRLLVKKTNKVVTVSDEVRRFTIEQEKLPSNKVVRIYNGIDLERFHRKQEPQRVFHELGMKHGDIILGSVGRIAPQKGFQDFLEILPMILEKNKKVKYIIVGDGPHRNKLEKIVASKHLTGKVIFAGERENIPDVLNVFSLFILPSHWEGLPTVVLEAMAVEKVVIASSLPQIGEIITDGVNGFLVDFTRKDMVISLIDNLIAQPHNLLEIGKRARMRVREMFTIEEMVKNHENLYEQELREINSTTNG